MNLAVKANFILSKHCLYNGITPLLGNLHLICLVAMCTGEMPIAIPVISASTRHYRQKELELCRAYENQIQSATKL